MNTGTLNHPQVHEKISALMILKTGNKLYTISSSIPLLLKLCNYFSEDQFLSSLDTSGSANYYLIVTSVFHHIALTTKMFL